MDTIAADRSQGRRFSASQVFGRMLALAAVLLVACEAVLAAPTAGAGAPTSASLTSATAGTTTGPVARKPAVRPPAKAPGAARLKPRSAFVPGGDKRVAPEAPAPTPTPKLKTRNAPTTPVAQLHAITTKTVGVEIQTIRTAAGGFMLDFRYKVVDAGKAEPLFRPKDKAYLIHQKSGARFLVPAPPKLGPMRNTDPPKQGRTYSIIFGNPGQYVKPGDKVTVVIGNYKVEDLVVL